MTTKNIVALLICFTTSSVMYAADNTLLAKSSAVTIERDAQSGDGIAKYTAFICSDEKTDRQVIWTRAQQEWKINNNDWDYSEAYMTIRKHYCLWRMYEYRVPFRGEYNRKNKEKK